MTMTWSRWVHAILPARQHLDAIDPSTRESYGPCVLGSHLLACDVKNHKKFTNRGCKIPTCRSRAQPQLTPSSWMIGGHAIEDHPGAPTAVILKSIQKQEGLPELELHQPPNNMPNPYKTYEKGSEGAGIAGAAAGASGGFPNPMGGVQNAQKAYHMHQYGKIVSLERWNDDMETEQWKTKTLVSNRKAWNKPWWTKIERARINVSTRHRKHRLLRWPTDRMGLPERMVMYKTRMERSLTRVRSNLRGGDGWFLYAVLCLKYPGHRWTPYYSISLFLPFDHNQRIHQPYWPPTDQLFPGDSLKSESAIKNNCRCPTFWQ